MSSFDWRRKLVELHYREKKITEEFFLNAMLEISEKEEAEAKDKKAQSDADRERELKKREIDLELIREQNKAPRVSSPQKLSVVFVFCEGSLPVGTCFAVRDKDDKNMYVLTASHNLRSPSAVGDKYYLASVLTRSTTGAVSFIPSPMIEVELKEWDDVSDWAILGRTDGCHFHDCIEIRTSACVREDKVKTYHCPVSLFTQKDAGACTILQACTASWSKVNVIDGSTILAETGLVKGSSGGVMLDVDGKAVAIYVASLSSCEVTGRAAAIAVSVAENPLSMKEGRVIAFTPKLREYFV